MTVSPALASRLSDTGLLTDRAFVGGVWTSAEDAGKSFEVTNPATGEVLAVLPDIAVAETRRAIDVAEKAQKAWAKRTGKDRSAVLKAWHRMWVESVDDLAAI